MGLIGNIKEKLSDMKELKAIENKAYEEEMIVQKTISKDISIERAKEKGKERAQKRNKPIGDRFADFNDKMQEAQEKGLFDLGFKYTDK